VPFRSRANSGERGFAPAYRTAVMGVPDKLPHQAGPRFQAVQFVEATGAHQDARIGRLGLGASEEIGETRLRTVRRPFVQLADRLLSLRSRSLHQAIRTQSPARSIVVRCG
jgi:hypothetical protein